MTFTEVATMIHSIGVPYAYYQFPEGTDQACPFICFYFDSSSDFSADNRNYQKIRPLSIELYTDNKDFALEMTIEAALKAAGLPFVRSETYIEKERMYQITYESEVLISNA